MVPVTTGCGGADCEGRILRERRMELGMTQEVRYNNLRKFRIRS